MWDNLHKQTEVPSTFSLKQSKSNPNKHFFRKGFNLG